MLKKLLKYDLRAIFKYWWIAAASSLGLAVLCGLVIRLLNDTKLGQNTFFAIFAVLIIFLTVIGISAFMVSAEVFIFIRYYQNLFSDEGYLTFTLPVKRHQLLNSKLISAILISFATIVTVVLDSLTVLLLIFGFCIFTPDFWGYIFALLQISINGTLAEMGFWAIVYALEIIVLVLALGLFSTLMVFAAITFAAMITKKNKVLAAIGIYYGANSLISFIVQTIFTIGLIGLGNRIGLLPMQSTIGLGALLIFIFTVLVCAVTVALYAFVHWMLDRKLNLA
jgi:hypothetical protein